ncbi:MAG: guanylate kinase [Pseudomonadota bacterium]
MSQTTSGAAGAPPKFQAAAVVPRRGVMLVISSPSGAGKTTLSRRLLASDGNLVLSVSATTRPRRPAEIDGRDYHFLETAAFEAMVAEGAFLEFARVFDHAYGTPRAPVEAWLAEGRDVLFDVDWQGAQQLRQAMRDDVASVFILPPSIEVLSSRLSKRGQDSADVVARRMRKAHDEISHWAEYDYVIVNDQLDAAEASLAGVLAAERSRRTRQHGLTDFVRGLGCAPSTTD